MYEIDKEGFGAFLARLWKEQGLTQRALAERLYLSDKAVSKWERGLSLPDVTLLIPLADCLGVSVTELLRGERTERETLPVAEVEALVSASIRLTGEAQRAGERRRKGWKLAFVLCALAGLAQTAALLTVRGFGWAGLAAGGHGDFSRPVVDRPPALAVAAPGGGAGPAPGRRAGDVPCRHRDGQATRID